MADNSKIEWTEATWNPITGCSVVSPGCTNCYAMKLAGTRLRHHPSREGLTRDSKAGPVWTGEVRFNEQWLDQPLRWKRPRMIFVCAHGDLFHENVPDEWIDRVFAVMVLAPQHNFQVLTKRSARMRDCLNDPAVRDRIETLAFDWLDTNAGRDTAEDWWRTEPPWPLPNIWLGVSVEDQARADERIPDLLDTPAAVRWISAEPLLGDVDLGCVPRPVGWPVPLDDVSDGIDPLFHVRAHLDWVICGGESGPRSRPTNPRWFRDLRDQCAAAGVPFFMKQMTKKGPIPDDLMVREWPRCTAFEVIDD